MHARTGLVALLLVSLGVLTTSCGGAGLSESLVEEAPGDPVLDLAIPIWYVIADSGGANGGDDWLGSVDITLTAPAINHQTIGTGTGTSTIEAAAFWPGTDTLYAFNPDRLGTINLTTGVWTQVINRDVWDDGNAAVFSGLDAARNTETLAPNTFSDIDSMFFDPNTGVGYAVARIAGADALFIFSETTGRIVRGAFDIGGTTYDYFRVPPVQPGNTDIDDIAIDPDDGQLYGVANGGGNNDRLVKIDKFTGVSSDVGLLVTTDVEGFSFYNDGSMWGVTGASSQVVADRNSVWSINTITGAAFDRRPLTAGGGDFESMAFLTGDLNQYCGRVWCDDNGNGTQDAGENGVANVTLVLWRDLNDNDLLDADTDIALVTTTTDALGDYCFAVASVGEYVITLRPDTLPADFVLSGANVLPASGPNVGDVVTGLDFIKVGAVGAIGDVVYFDVDGDGLQDPEEPGLRGVTVNLLDPGVDGLCGTADDVAITSTVTDGGGYYFFGSNVDGSYCVDVDESTLPLGYVLTSANEPHLATIVGGSNDFTADFGYQIPGRIGDFVWLDTNGDGVQDPGEPGLAGVDVTLVTPGLDGFFGTADDITVGTVVTGTDGSYIFGGLLPGSYEVQVDDTDAPAGSTRTTPAPLHVTLRVGQALLDADFGYVGNTSIGDLVWNDVDSSGTQNGGELGIGGVTVTLIESGPDGTLGTSDDLDFGSQVTAADGSYLFSGLPGGSYRVDVDESTLPVGLRTATTPAPIDINLTAGVDNLTADFGYKLDDATIGDRVWDDTNGNGTQDGGEPGFVGVTVNLTEAGPDGTFGTADDVSLPAQVTVANGAYDFTALPAGSYRVDVDESTLPAGVSLTTGNEPLDVTLAGSQDYNLADFGYWLVSSIGDRVWEDYDNDGVQDAGEPGINGVTVNLTEAGPDATFGTADDVSLPPQLTTGNGDYLFTALAPGLYRVDVDDGTLFPGLVTTTANDPLDVNLAAGVDDLTADFGYFAPSSIGDRVWDDLNGNGVQDASEPGLVGVTVNLTEAGPDGTFGTADDVTYPPQVTIANGIYTFSNLPLGFYQIDVDDTTVPAGFAQTTVDPILLNLPQGTDRTDMDFGYWMSASVGDRVWLDLDADGVQDGSEPGLVGVTVNLTEAGPDATLGTADDVTFPPQVTVANGIYDFTGLAPGLYRVDVDDTSLPAGLALTTANDPTDQVLTPGDDINTVDFGYRHTGNIGDRVWNDINGNGTQDAGEPGLVGVTVDVSEAGPDGTLGTADDVPFPPQVTVANGIYTLDNLPAGLYRVDVDESTVPAGFGLTTSNDPTDVTLAAGESRTDVDFGFWLSASLGDRVWLDLNADGVQDAGEPGLVGVDVALTEAGPDATLGTADDVSFPPQTTVANGAYDFVGLAPGLYRVDVVDGTLPAGVALSTANDPTDQVLTPGDDINSVDFGYRHTGTIGDRVWNDTDGDTAQDAGEAGLVGVTVNLTEAGPDATLGTADDVPFPPQVTVANGAYSFDNLPAGTYRVDVDNTTLPPGLTSSTSNDPTDVVLPAGGTRTDVDFGYWQPASVGDRVWADLNANGTQDAGEPGLVGVDVTLTGAGVDGTLGTADDVSFPTQTTVANGAYDFVNLPPDLYRVDVVDATVPAGMALSTANDPTDQAVTPGDDINSVDFGYRHTGTLGDRVWNDTDGDTVQDAGEAGLVGVTVNLTEAGPDATLGTADDVGFPPQVTVANGAYSFDNLPAGTYRVDVDNTTLPPGLTSSTSNDPTDVVLPAGGTRTDVDFGYWQPASIGDRVWSDLNANGTQDAGEPGLVGVDVTLTGAGADGALGTPDDVSFPSQTTVADGAYDFISLPPDLYRVDVVDATLPAGVALSTANDPTDQAVTPGDDINSVDFGYRHTGTIGDRVWNDTDGDTAQDAGEAGLVGVTVNLTEAGPDATLGTADDVPFPPQVTVANGAYSFDNLPAGTYRVDVDNATLPPGLTSSTSNDPTDVVLPAGGTRTDVDFGYWQPASVGDRVWADLDANGTQDAGEPGLVGVDVTLTGAGVDGTLGTADDVSFPTQTTVANGAYDFINLPPDLYRVDVVDGTVPAGMALTTSNDPTDQAVTPGDDINSVDFGYRHTGTLGDRVWNDTDGDTVQDAGEAGLVGVTVNLTEAGPDATLGTADDVPFPPQVTVVNGAYSFDNLPAGTYRVDVDNTTLPPGQTSSTSNDPTDVVLPAGGTRTDVDFGYWQPATIGDRVWSDLNANGTQDAGEPGLVGVDVTLTGAGADGTLGTADDVSFPTQTTVANGAYDFINLSPDLYRVDVFDATVPAGMALTTANDPTDQAVTPGDDINSVDFGYRHTGVIGDLVWDDVNGNGVQDPGEPGIGGVRLDYGGAGPDGICGTADDVPIGFVVTAPNGAYTVTNLPADTYCVVVDGTTVPPGFVPTFGVGIQTVTLAPGQVDNAVDFGYRQVAAIGDRVWHDLDEDGAQDPGEPGLVGVTVNLVEAGPDGTLGTPDDVTFPPQVTVANGAYMFTGLLPGSYRVTVDGTTIPSGMVLTTANLPHDVVLAPGGGGYSLADFGYQFNASIGDRVWRDTNEDGVQDAGEAGINGVTVNLVGDGADNTFGTADDVTFAPQVTTGDGDYDFGNLAPDTYRVSVTAATLPAGMALTTGNEPLDVVLAPSVDYDLADFGYEFAGTIGDRVWQDLDRDTVQDAGEPGINGVTVNLVEAGPDGSLGTADDVSFPPQNTAGNGNYLFDNLAPGTYRVSVNGATVPAGMALTTANEPLDVVLAPSQTFVDGDFGYEFAGSIGDRIWRDTNEDGVQDAGEAGINGVTVNLVGDGADNTFGTADDVTLPAQVTAGDGDYDFGNLAPDTYRVSVGAGIPAGMLITTGNEPLDVVLAAGLDYDLADFGYEFAGTIGDRVWNDLDFNGTQDAGEPGLNGVTVNLVEAGPDGTLGTADDVALPPQITAGDGDYLFDNLPPGLYRVTVGAGVPAGMVLTTANQPLDVTLNPAQGFTTADFGYQTLSSIGDRVWQDTNEDGVQDAGEPGLNGVTVNLVEAGADGTLGTADDVTFPPQVTAGDGDYSFTGLTPGLYRVSVDGATVPAGMPLTTGNEPLDVALGPDQTFVDADFGYEFDGSIGDRVWNDLDFNGTQDAGEPGLNGVTVNLIEAGPDGTLGTADDVALPPQVTSGDGDYLFDNLPPGSYRVSVGAGVPAGMVLTTANQPLDVTLNPSQGFTTADFGYQTLSSIGDRVWQDTNEDGVQDAGEPGLNGVTVNLVEAGADGTLGTADDVTFPPQVTAGDGDYNFTGLTPGLYRVSVDGATVPAGMPLTTGNEPLDVALGPDQTFVAADFGYEFDGSIGDRVWNDLDFNGIQDAGEPGLNGVTVNLIEAGPDGTLGTADDVALPPQITAGDGDYLFDNLPPGSYRVTVGAGVPAGMVLTTANQPLDVTLNPSQGFTTADFGYQTLSSIGDRVWQDTNEDGVQDAGEPGLNGVTVNLVEAGADGTLGTADDVTFPPQVTAGDGDYNFTGLTPGLYRVSVDGATVPAGMPLTTGNEPLDVALGPDQTFVDADFGYEFDGSIGDRVWNDLDFNGTQDAGEPGLNGVTVILVEAGPDGTLGTADDVALPPQVTSGDGDYLFDNLPPGLYRVTVGAGVPAGMVLTTANQPLDVTLNPSQGFTTADFGYQTLSSIGDRVWQDTNEDGVQDAGEPGLNGVTVNLVEAGADGTLGTADDVTFPPQVTAGDGDYNFAGLTPGLYRVSVDGATVPAGMPLTTGNEPLDVALGADQTFVDADFGYEFDGTIGDRVWNDLDFNGTQDAGEPGLNGVTVNLVEAGPDGTLGTADDVTFPPQVTSGDGDYLFDNLPPGSYRVSVGAGVPAGMGLTTANEPLDVTLNPSQSLTTADFGYQTLGSIGDFVWRDLNGDGVQDAGELGINGVTVNLVEAGVDGTLGTTDDVSFPPQVTAGGGAYTFGSLPPGLYRVSVDAGTVPAGMNLTTANEPLDVALGVTQVFADADFGYRDSGTLGDLVWEDTNSNGVLDAGEPGIDGVTVNLVEAGPDSLFGTADDVPVGSQVTAGGGLYDFQFLPPGLYSASVDESTLPIPMNRVSGTNPHNATLASGEDYNDADFGYLPIPFTVGDVIWIDSDGDNVYEPDMGEAPVPGVLVNIYDAGGNLVGTDTTGADGAYRFIVFGGTYRVELDPSNFAPGGPLAGLTSSGAGTDVTATVSSDRFDLDFGFRRQGATTIQYCQWWTTNTAAWPLTSIMLGNSPHNQAQAMAILNEGNLLQASYYSGRAGARASVNPDVSVQVAWALIGAKLNVGMGNDSSSIESTLRAADDWLAVVGIGSGVRQDHPQYWSGKALYNAINAWNTGN